MILLRLIYNYSVLRGRMSEFLVALTGGIASGKSLVARQFACHGIFTVEADQIARELVVPSSLFLNKIIEKFGESILTSEGTLHRENLRKIIFSDTASRKWLEALLHPTIYKTILERGKQAPSPYSILVIPLLVETLPNPKTFFDSILVVDTTVKNQIDRLKKRDRLSDREIKAILKTQADRKKRLSYADDIIPNNSTRKELITRVNKLHDRYIAANVKAEAL